MQRKGCDASNMFDEEVPVLDQEYSDDDLERDAKRSKKQQHQKKASNKTGGDDSSMEEGELPSKPQNKKRSYQDRQQPAKRS